MNRPIYVIIGLALLGMGCDYNITIPSPNINVNSVNNNTNTNPNTINISDVINFNPVTDPTSPVPCQTNTCGPTGTETPLSIPLNAESIARTVANANAHALITSCQATLGSSAWLFLDTLINTLKSGDPRWGYLIRTTGQASQDTIAYRATSDNTGVWGVDVIGNHCGVNPTFTWNVIGFDPTLQWSSSRTQ